MMIRSVSSTPGSSRGRDPARDHHVPGVDLRAVDLHGRPRQELRGSLHDGDPAGFDQPGDALDQLVDDLVLEREHRRPIGVAGGLDAPFLRAIDRVHHRRGLQQRLGRDAATDEAGAAQPIVALDDGDTLAHLCRPESRGVAAGAGADHDDVVRVRHRSSSLLGRSRTDVSRSEPADYHSEPMPPSTRADAMPDASDAPQELKRTPLEAEHLRLGAKMAAFAGWKMPIEYEGALAEHRNVRTHVGLFDLTHLGKVEVVGPGALGMLQRLVTNDLSRAGVGDALYNLVLNEGGGVIEDLIVYRLGEERYFVVPNASNAPRVLRMLEEETSDEPLHLMYHQDWCFLAVQGPESKDVMAGLFPDAKDLGLHALLRGRVPSPACDRDAVGVHGRGGFRALHLPGHRGGALGRAARLCPHVRRRTLRARREGRPPARDGLPALRAGSLRGINRVRGGPRLGRRHGQG